MKKTIFIIIVIGALLALQNYLQKFDNQAIMVVSSSGKNENIEGYISNWDNNFIYIVDLEEKEEVIRLKENTVFLRTYIGENNNLLKQEKIKADDLIKDQFINIDIYKDEDKKEALIVRQVIYVED